MYLIRSGAIEGYWSLVSRYQQNPTAILDQVGLSAAQLQEPDALVSYQRLADLLDISSDVCNAPFFSLQLTTAQSPMIFGDLSIVSVQQETLRDVLEVSQRHIHLHAMGVNVDILSDDQYTEFVLGFAFNNAYGLRQLIQLSVGHMFITVRTVLGGDQPELQIHLQQAAPAESKWAEVPEQYRQQIVFNSHFDGVRFPTQWLQRKPASHEEELREYFQRRVQFLERAYPDNLQAQARYIISNLLASGECTLERVSAGLNLHPRTLQRKLSDEGTSFRELLQKNRRDTAEHYLRYTNISITDLALNLGYAEVAVFSRHFKQWTGQSPRVWQQAATQSGHPPPKA